MTNQFRRLLFILAVASASCILSGSVSAQELKSSRTNAPIVIDGRLEDVWNSSDSISGFTQFEPEYNEPELFGTTVRVLYDSEMIYFAFECKDPEPARITAKKTRRDDNLPEDDGVVVFLDTFHDKNTSYFFAVNPIGTQSDGIFTDNGRTVDVDWDTRWESACSITADGWIAEIGIPFSVLKFDAKTDVWGFNAERRTARTFERSFWIGGLTKMFMISQFGELTNLDLGELNAKKYTIIPYSQFQFRKGAETENKTGIDMRYNLLSNIGIEATFNPDFATIESDVEQVNMTRFELSYPEKRPFFLEGAENYSTRIKQFYSRRIGEIPWGVKLNGKLSNWKINSLITKSDPSSAGADIAEGEDALYTVFRASRESGNGSNIGIIGANRTYRDKNSGSFGLVSTLFFTDVLGMTSQVIKSHGDADKGTWTYFVRPAYDSQFTHFHMRYSHFGEGVMENMNSVGFVRDDNRREFDTEFDHKFWINRFGIEKITPAVNYNRYYSLGGELRSWEDRNSLSVSFLKKWHYKLRHTEEFIRFEKDFRNRAVSNEIEYNNKMGLALSLSYSNGINYDRDYERLTGGMDVKLLEGWDMSYNFSKHWYRPANENDNTWIHYVRSTYFIHKDLYFKLFYQTKHSLDRGFPADDSDLLRKTFQLAFVWRIIPPFGSLQIAYQEGSTRFTDTQSDEKSLFTKLSWVF